MVLAGGRRCACVQGAVGRLLSAGPRERPAARGERLHHPVSRRRARPRSIALIDIYNQHGRRLRAERVRGCRSSHHFLTQSAGEVSPSGAVDPGPRSKAAVSLSTRPPSAGCSAPGERPAVAWRRWPRPARRRARWRALAPDAVEVVASAGRAPAASCRRGTFMDRGFTRSFLLIEELTEELRQAEKSRLREADPHDVPRGEQLGGGVQLAC